MEEHSLLLLGLAKESGLLILGGDYINCQYYFKKGADQIVKR